MWSFKLKILIYQEARLKTDSELNSTRIAHQQQSLIWLVNLSVQATKWAAFASIRIIVNINQRVQFNLPSVFNDCLCESVMGFLYFFVLFTSIYIARSLTGSEFQRCGLKRSLNKSASVGSRIFGGEKLDKIEFPWLAALHHRSLRSFFCAGSLISSNHVLSGKPLID